MSEKYAFGWYEKDAVECPELDAFLADLDAVLKKHGVGVRLEGGYEERSHLELTPYDGDLSVFTDDLEESRGIPWIDAARERSKALTEARHKREHQEREAARRAQADAAAAAAVAHGIEMGGKRYRLVPE